MISDKPLRSVLYVPVGNSRALTKAASLACDAVVLDLEDSVAPEQKAEARKNLEAWFSDPGGYSGPVVVRVNPLSSEWGAEDIALARRLEPDAVLLPKVDSPRDIIQAADALGDDSLSGPRIWAMIETPRAMMNLGAIAELGRDPGSRLTCFVAGTNDLAKETGVSATPDRRYLVPWLMQIVLAARAGGLSVLDAVANDFRDLGAFQRECAEASAMGFDGKTLIHPSQIEPANAAFSPSPEAVGEAERIVAAFVVPENAGKAVISMEGRMVERLHLVQAERLLARAGRTRS
ncbi:CoA ester lyase [Pseudaminobacter sp. 19-2017]|uniref:CoA ester lyase n=1 Tax=Pseudaminobacter soli (ex Zhang et al. 2022) TaxID=2831468 RepID=A0A942DYJ1_9HYPH|nr:CoA ester lyase [Pseudaminobacter soli]MBS3649966.1 CoA ester lyase [Pseudaminobacter soli]